MTTYSWTAGVNADWTTSTDWDTGTIPNDSSAIAILASAATSYVVQIGPADSVIVNTLTIGSLAGSTGPTLQVAGTLTFAGSGSGSADYRGGITAAATGLIQGAGELGTSYIAGVAFPIENDGTIDANGGTAAPLVILSTFSNSGTLRADNGSLLIEGPSFANLSGTTLTGGTYIVSGPTAGTVNEIEFGIGFTADMVIDAATIVLSGAASDIQGYSGGIFQSLETQLQTIASGGTLQLLNSRGYNTGNALTDAGEVNLQGGTLGAASLAISATGTLSGYGVVAAGIGNQGAVIASGGTLGALTLQDPVSGVGVLSAVAGSSLIMPGGTAGGLSIAAGATLLDTGTLNVTGAAEGAGTIAVAGTAGELSMTGPSSLDINFSGAVVGVTLAAPTQYSGTLIGFGIGDSLVLDGIAANSATVVAGNTLAVMSGANTVESVALGGDYSAASFTAMTVGGNTVVQNTGGAPARQDMPFVLSNFTDNAGLSTTLEGEILADLTAAADNWAQYITSVIPLRVSLTINTTGAFGGELAQGSPGALISTGQTVSGHLLYEPNSEYALLTGGYASGTTTDVSITLFANASNLASFDYSTNASDPVPLNQYDVVSVLTHEFAHGLGFIGLINSLSPTPGSPPVSPGAEISTFDQFVTTTISNGNTLAYFTGASAEAAYASLIGSSTPAPVPVTYIAGDAENFYHFATAASDPLGKDLMSGVGLGSGTVVSLSAVDLAVLRDIGIPVSADVVCYARGTRIAVQNGETAIEDLRVGDAVMTAGGDIVPIVWIGRRRVDCRRHPAPHRVQPIRIQAHAFAPDLPHRDLLVSPRHSIYCMNVLIPARLLVNGSTVTQLDVDSITYFHVELAQHDLVLAEGLPSESYLDSGDRHYFENSGALITLHPDFGTLAWEGAACADIRVVGPEVEAVRAHLLARADSLAEVPDISTQTHLA
jgi:hypothetical protein